MHVGVFRLGVGLQVGGFGGPIGILPHDERFVQGVEAVAAQRGGVDGEGLLVAFGVCEVQGQGVGDPAFLLEGPDDSIDEVGGHGFVLVGQDDVHVATAMRPISDMLFKIRACLQDSCGSQCTPTACLATSLLESSYGSKMKELGNLFTFQICRVCSRRQ